MRECKYFLILLCLICATGCITEKLSGTNIRTVYGSADSINEEVSININK